MLRLQLRLAIVIILLKISVISKDDFLWRGSAIVEIDAFSVVVRPLDPAAFFHFLNCSLHGQIVKLSLFDIDRAIPVLHFANYGDAPLSLFWSVFVLVRAHELTLWWSLRHVHWVFVSEENWWRLLLQDSGRGGVRLSLIHIYGRQSAPFILFANWRSRFLRRFVNRRLFSDDWRLVARRLYQAIKCLLSASAIGRICRVLLGRDKEVLHLPLASRILILSFETKFLIAIRLKL